MLHLAVVVSLFAVGCRGKSDVRTPTVPDSAQKRASVTGRVTYLQRIALPPGSVINVKLVDVSRQDAPAITIGEQKIVTTSEQVPVSFEIKYNPTEIKPDHTYAIQASITIDGRLRWVTATIHQVITQGHPNTVEIVLQSAT